MFMQKFFEHFPKRWPRMNTQRERKRGKFGSSRKLSFVWGKLLINLKGFLTTWWKIKNKQKWVINNCQASNVDVKEFTWILCSIIDLLMVFTFEQKNFQNEKQNLHRKLNLIICRGTHEHDQQLVFLREMGEGNTLYLHIFGTFSQ